MATKTRTKLENKRYDWGMLAVVMALLAFGLVMVFSSSFAQALTGYNDPFYFIFRQGMWTIIGLTAMIIAARIPYIFWEKWSIVFMGGALLALLAVIPLGSDLWGASRTFFGGSVQPSEPAKIIIIIYVSTWLASKGDRIRDVRVGLVPFSMLLGIVTVLIVSQPDISSAILIVSTALTMFFIAGADLKQLLLIGLGTSLTFWAVVTQSTYAGARIQKYMDSISDPMQSAEWQVQRMVEALASGGPIGTGIGNGTGKFQGYVPLSWSDNIFAIIGEEMGLLGGLLVVMLFALFAYRGLRAALGAPDSFGMLLATGITALIVLQALLNMAVVVAVAPPTGVTLPFISYGGSSLVTMLGAVGILLSISRFGRDVSPNLNSGKLAYARLDFGGRDRGTRLSRAGSGRTTASRAIPRQSATRQRATRQPTTRRTTQSQSTRQGRTKRAASRTSAARRSSSRTSGSRTSRAKSSSRARSN